MYGQKETLYDILELPHNAPPGDIEKAYQNRAAELRKQTAAQDPRRVALLREAREVLSDPERRAAYDRSLRSETFLGPAETTPLPWKPIGIGVAAVVAAIALYFVLRPPPPAKPGTPKEVLAAITDSLGYLENLDVGGRTTPVGLSVAIDETTLITTCHGIRAGAQLVVNNGAALVPARVTLADQDLDLCKVAIDSGRKPAKLGGPEPTAGDTVYALGSTESGGLIFAAGTVVDLVATPKGKLVEITIPIPSQASGGPVLDPFGRVLAIATAPNPVGAGRHFAIPVGWIREMRSRAPETAPAKPPENKAPEPRPRARK
jgi:S1-C subfamily serine protease